MSKRQPYRPEGRKRVGPYWLETRTYEAVKAILDCTGITWSDAHEHAMRQWVTSILGSVDPWRRGDTFDPTRGEVPNEPEEKKR